MQTDCVYGRSRRWRLETVCEERSREAAWGGAAEGEGGGGGGGERQGEEHGKERRDFRVGELIPQRLTEIFPRDGLPKSSFWRPSGPTAPL